MITWEKLAYLAIVAFMIAYCVKLDAPPHAWAVCFAITSVAGWFLEFIESRVGSAEKCRPFCNLTVNNNPTKDDESCP